MEENAGYQRALAGMPYLSRLASEYALATQYYANTHPSIGNYFMLTVGDTISNNDGYSEIVRRDNVVRELLAAHRTWKSYAEDLPAVGYTGPQSGKYARKHNTLALLSDVVEDPLQRTNLVPFSQFRRDLANNALPNYGFIVPNLCHDAHDCSLDSADTWLKTEIDPLIRSTTFRKDGLLIIVFDEADRDDDTHGGGRIVCVIVSPKTKHGYRSTMLYQHQSTLRLSLEALRVTAFPNSGSTTRDMDEFFEPLARAREPPPAQP